MSNHDQYQQLGALAAIGQITPEEDKVLNIHLSECPSCRDAYADYVRLLHKQLPQAEPRRWRSPDVSRSMQNGDLRERFCAWARADGIDLSGEAVHQRYGTVGAWWDSLQWRQAVAAAAIVTVVVLGAFASRQYRFVPRSPAQSSQTLVLTTENERLQGKLSDVRRSIELQSAELARVERENSVSASLMRALRCQLEDTRLEAKQLTSELQKAQQEGVKLTSANQQDLALIAELRSQIDKLNLTRADYRSKLVLQDTQIRDLTEALQVQNDSVERERQLTEAGKDIRQLMGARNLHIIDVHDVDGIGKSSKSFGRAFYAQGQSLIFYAFDLPSGKLAAAKYYFQAWGQREAASKSARNLGTFQVDDHEQRRWVLKMNDPALLKNIDAVFVTAEVVGDAQEPRGKKILYAYLGGQPNHP